MSNEEEDTCTYTQTFASTGCMSYEEEDTCHMRRRIHAHTHRLLQALDAAAPNG
jgi:hypothetical protein